jgi:hypothetical protein
MSQVSEIMAKAHFYRDTYPDRKVGLLLVSRYPLSAGIRAMFMPRSNAACIVFGSRDDDDTLIGAINGLLSGLGERELDAAASERFGWYHAPELPFDWNAAAFAKLQRLGIYVDRRAYGAAERAYNAACSWGMHTKYDDPDDPEFYERQQKFDDAEYDMLVLMRQALSIPEGDPSLPAPGYRYDIRHPSECPEPEEA